MSIMTYELVRRLQVLHEKLDKSEVISVIDKYVQQLCNSEFNWKQIRDKIVSALKGYSRKEKLRKLKNRGRYRSGKESLRTRVDKKLNEKYNWFRKRKDSNDETEEISENKENEEKNEIEDNKKGKWRHYRKRKEKISSLEKETAPDSPAKAVLFLQYTRNSELAGEIRELLNSLKPWTGIRYRIQSCRKGGR